MGDFSQGKFAFNRRLFTIKYESLPAPVQNSPQLLGYSSEVAKVIVDGNFLSPPPHAVLAAWRQKQQQQRHSAVGHKKRRVLKGTSHLIKS